MAPVLLTPPEEDASGASVTGSPEAVEDSAAAEVEDESSVDVEDDAELDALLLDEVSVDDAGRRNGLECRQGRHAGGGSYDGGSHVRGGAAAVLEVSALKGVPRFYNARTADPFSRLRVPRYLKAWEALFFAVFLCLYYGVLVELNTERITPTEATLYVWFAAFCYDELSEWNDAGSIFYAADIWNLFDMIMIGIGVTFAILRVIGLVNDDQYITDLAFNVFSLEALFMVPRIFSFLSLSPYFGTLIPCL
ncbi:hypothetical protein BN1723_019041, partial [Verticillium longisporum]